ncbi:MAG: Rieske (2Fe-2S) protein, partial [Alphaproteobacteria bacterium]
DRTGRCVRVPQQASVGPRIGVQAFKCEERYGYVWVCLGEPLTGIPEVPEFGRTEYRFIHEFSEAWDVNVMRLIENAFDNAHFSFVHASSFGNQAQPEPASLTIAPTEFGFVMDTVVPVRNAETLKATLRMDVAETMRTYQKVWWMPFSVLMRLSYPNGLKHIIVAMITPIDDKRLMFNQFVLRNDTDADVSPAQVIAWDRTVTNEDRALLRLCDWDVPLDVRSPDEFHMASDRPGLEVRRRLLELLHAHGEEEVRREDRPQTAGVSAAAE